VKSWEQEIALTWLRKPACVASLDTWVRERLIAHRPTAKAESVAPWTVETLSQEIDRLGREQRWLWCTAAIALLGELVFCAKDGGTFASRAVAYRRDLALDVEALRVVRNAVFHPAFQNRAAGSGVLHIEKLFELLDNDDDADVREAAIKLAVDWSHRASRPVTSYALRKLKSAGNAYAAELGLLGSWSD